VVAVPKAHATAIAPAVGQGCTGHDRDGDREL